MEKLKVFMTIFNRFNWAIPMCEKFEQAGLEVILIDNGSTFPPCVEWLKNCNYKIERMGYNRAPWVFLCGKDAVMKNLNTPGDPDDLYMKYKDRFFILSDSDFDISTVPDDFPEHLMKGLETAQRGEWKCGLSYEINDLPDNSVAKQVYDYEKRYWVTKNKHGYYEGQVDIGVTLFDRSKQTEWYHALRSDRPYTARHLDWYLSDEALREEDLYFWEHTTGYYGWGKKWYDEIILKLPPR